MKVLHVIATADPRSGGPIHGVIAGSEIWRRHGCERHVLTLDPPTAPWIGALPMNVIAVGMDGPMADWIRRHVPISRYGYSPRLVRWLKKNAANYDAIIVNGLWNYASLGAWRALRGGGAPYVVFTHGMLDPWFNRAYPVKTLFKRLYWLLLEHRVLRDARGVMFTAEEERRLARNSFKPYVARDHVAGYGARRVEGDPEAQIAAFFATAPELRGRGFILFLSRIDEKKGVDLLIQAFARAVEDFPDVDIVIAGPDQSGLKARLAALARAMNIGARIHWPGMLSGDAKWGAFRAAKFFVLPSHQENFGIVVAEALSLGTPVLITDKVNIWREVEADGAGVVVSDDVDGVERGLRHLCGLSAAEREAMTRAARACFDARFDLDANALDFLALMKRLCAADNHAAQAGEIFSSPPI
ncbi:glycosyltransferase [Rhodoblastus acidophilus]|uniref:Glycosyltransferase n=1 Tax=Candidatus Rhodoblastus alkanivorans TaxID=2954117 RepID=A0ABS9Z8B2_9HYPH|nr:glycosyltransferase [Candidatus Rhodoblastus alkanivorans]MCI4679530.1 glycosyltransferase [Candidatus Rhodoblastus alkanivorans]MCI4683281.1 glycosyltransferase [Candidatus Rhodoblastus alkanivorans]MDI4640593.1 glycosyltransferase [Rhodoblastus acidophilus]